MKSNRWQAAVLVMMIPLAVACSDVEVAESSYDAPATLKEVKGTDLMEVTLTDRAVERVGLTTEAVTAGPEGLVIPYSAVIYSADGTTWVYKVVKGTTFVRTEVAIARIDGDRAFLVTGPEAGTKLATVGATELYGTENGL